MSDSQSNIFPQNDKPAGSGDATPQPNHQTDAFADLLGSIQNEKGEPKYKDVKTALEALRHSQEYIPQLKTDKEKTEAQLAALAAEVERLKEVEKSVQRLTEQRAQDDGKPPTPSLSADNVADLVNKTLTAREIAARSQANTQLVVDAMQSAYGEKASETFYSTAKGLGFSAEEINTLSSKNPTAVLKLFGLTEKKVRPNSETPLSSGSINSAGIQRNEESYIGRNTKPTLIGATTEDLNAERENSKRLVEELHNEGLSMADLSDPKNYFKRFGTK